MATKLDTKALELALDEQRRDYDVLHGLHEALKIKNLTFLTIAFGILGYLYSAGIKQKVPIRESLFFPKQAYGDIFYFVGVFLLLSSITGFIITMLKNRQWHTAFDDNQEDKIMDDYEEYLKYMHERYKKVSSTNSDCYEKRRYLFNISLYSLFMGATILLLIKTFGG